MLGTSQQRISRSKRRKTRVCRRAQRIFEYLGRRVGIGCVQRQSLPNPSLQLNFGSLSEGSLHIEILAKGAGKVAHIRDGVGPILNLIVEEIVKIGCVQRPAAGQETLL